MTGSNLHHYRAVSTLLLLLLSTRCVPSLAPERNSVGTGGQASGSTGGVPAATGGGGSPALGGSPSGGGASGGAMASGGAKASGGSGGAEPRGPTPPTAGANYPFPQNRQTQPCSYPNYRNSDVVTAYQRWKTDTVTSAGAGNHQRVQRPKDSGLEVNSTVSEGIGYGLILAVYMNDQPLFDELWKYEQLWLGQNGLMDWYISGNGTDRLGTGAATDADEDMAWALLMADRQWGGKGSLGDTYLNIANKQISSIYNNEIDPSKLVKPGDTWGDSSTINASYFAPSYYRAFGKAAVSAGQSADGWNQVLQASYDTLAKLLNDANGNSNNGLVPAWGKSDGSTNPSAFMNAMPPMTAPTNYQYDSCRTPFRIGLDYCMNSEPRAQAYVAKTSQFFARIGAKNIVDGYQLNGTPQPQNTTGQSAAFVGPAAVGAMSAASYQSLLQDGYDAIAPGTLLVGGQYYDESWTVLTLLMMTGNFIDYTTQPPFMP